MYTEDKATSSLYDAQFDYLLERSISVDIERQEILNSWRDTFGGSLPENVLVR